MSGKTAPADLASAGVFSQNLQNQFLWNQTPVGGVLLQMMFTEATTGTIEPPDTAEVELIRRAREGDHAAWEQLMYQFQQPLFRLVYLILGDGAEAEDIAQEAFIRAYLSLRQFDVKRPFRPWLLQIAVNLARNRQRSLGRYLAALRRWWQDDPPRQPEENSEVQILWQAVQKLRQPAQEIIYLRYFLELSEAETAETLHIPTGTVKSRTHRALQELKKEIGEVR